MGGEGETLGSRGKFALCRPDPELSWRDRLAWLALADEQDELVVAGGFVQIQHRRSL